MQQRWTTRSEGGRANAQFGAIKIVEDEIAKIRITDLEIKP
jgi:hypothetical protein